MRPSQTGALPVSYTHLDVYKRQLKGREGSTVTVETENGPVSFEVNAASGVHLCDDEHLFD